MNNSKEYSSRAGEQYANHPKDPLQKLVIYFADHGFTLEDSHREVDLFLQYLLTYPRAERILEETHLNHRVDEVLKHKTSHR